MKTQKDPELIGKLMTKFLKNELSEQESKDFELWLASDPKNITLLESFRDTPSVQEELNYFNAIDTDKDWAMLSNKLNLKPSPKLSWIKIVSYGAAAMLLLVAGIGLYRYTASQSAKTPVLALQTDTYDIKPGGLKAQFIAADGSSTVLNGKTAQETDANLGTKEGFLWVKNTGRQKNGYNQLKTPKAGEYKMILPDGTKVFLNSASSLRFSNNFNKGDRRVELDGEAYFEVAHNQDLPFVVKFNKTEVEVLGTHFNISAYSEETTKTTLLEGAIKIRTEKDQGILKPGDEANVANGVLNVQKADTYKSIAWKEGMFYFHEDGITEILDQIARWYDVKIEYKGTPGTKKYSGDIRREASLNQVLQMLNAVSGAQFDLKDRTVTVNF
ncbi:FecR family protein [Pedobacter sp. ASV12]|uniref:FecR family protein n=1 Tax=Pedobacter sp. ASV12 TaxID=2795120 RepID=UPI0018EAC552|nr:FecR family protein [Pedobacter sp. ASV12]